MSLSSPSSWRDTEPSWLSMQRMFEVFDEERTGLITANALLIILRTLGFRITFPEVLRLIRSAKQKRYSCQNSNINKRKRQTNVTPQSPFSDTEAHDQEFQSIDEYDFDNHDEIDLDLLLNILSLEKFSDKSVHNEMKIAFRLFDLNNTGYITEENLNKIVTELEQEKSRQETNDYDYDDMGLAAMPIKLCLDDFKAMIQEFDNDLDGMISENEFMEIMECFD